MARCEQRRVGVQELSNWRGGRCGRRWQSGRVWMIVRATTVLDYACKNGGFGRIVETIWKKWFVAGA